MQGDEAFKCEVCDEKTEATKRLRLYRLPQVLLLHIKRFKYSGSSREKLTNNVTFPVKVCATLCLPVMSAGMCTLPHVVICHTWLVLAFVPMVITLLIICITLLIVLIILQ